MHTLSDLLADLAGLGIRPEERLLVHSSMKAIGAVEGGADTVIDALMQHLDSGLLLMPSHTWKEHNNRDGIYDPMTEPTCVGVLTERFRQRPGVIRSLSRNGSVPPRSSTTHS